MPYRIRVLDPRWCRCVNVGITCTRKVTIQDWARHWFDPINCGQSGLVYEIYEYPEEVKDECP